MKRDVETAFPFTDADGHHYQTGMSLRDWFAGKAIQGLLSREPVLAVSDLLIEPDAIEAMALSAYEIADAMMLARNAEPKREKP